MTNIKITESALMNFLWKFQYELFKEANGLSKQDVEIIEKHWKMLKLITEHTFDQISDRSNNDKIGNI